MQGIKGDNFETLLGAAKNAGSGAGNPKKRFTAQREVLGEVLETGDALRRSVSETAERARDNLTHSNYALHYLNNVSWLLAGFCCQSTRTFARSRTARRHLIPHGRTALDGADHRRFIHTIGIGHRGETLFGAHAIDQTLLPGAEHGVRKNGKIAEHPQQI
jgi:hypothetical protein